jgi:Uma2 family endonuclease
MAQPGIEEMPWVDPPTLPPTDLPYDDGAKMESPWHAHSLSIVTASIVASRGGSMEDYYVGANMFVYYSWNQVRNVDYKGPDLYFVDKVDGQKPRLYWAIWDEDGRYPDVIIELLSESTEKNDLGKKKDLYEQTFHASEYFCIASGVERLLGWRLRERRYTPIEHDEHGRLWSELLGCAIGGWKGFYMAQEHTWPRLFHRDGTLVLLPEEAQRQRADDERQRADDERQRANDERQRANDERQRADALAARLAELEAELQRLRGEI